MSNIQYLGTKTKTSFGCSSCGSSAIRAQKTVNQGRDVYHKGIKYSFKKGEVKQVSDDTALYLLKIKNDSLPVFRLV